MGIRRVKARAIMRDPYDGAQLARIYCEEKLPDEFEIVWQEPDVHQCDGLGPFHRIDHSDRGWFLRVNMDYKGEYTYLKVTRCPCCDWEAPTCDES